ncbi:LytR C-terminal domain-containing protein [Corynebacterium sp. P5848]|uniref:LytR C-terminal domain-containing protein n=1 Tax=Corynebacterium marambiense TaxID=2765364 RepID=UPI00226087C8|nr:LytR C-terminal domain-containing protein [Corynebacterium marambiense]MCX7543069.1 LytR C-terminal domain-containing protein [Corynebacterium marambiense]
MSPNKHNDEPLVHDGHPDDTAAAPAPVSETRPLPLRGLAMILAAVAVLLAAWALFAVLRGDDSDTTPVADEATSSTVPTSTAVSHATPVTSAPQEEMAPPSSSASGTSPGTEVAAPPQPAVPPAPAGDPRTVTVHALNNSTIQGLANRVADTLTGQGWTVGEVGNLADTYLPASAVYYTAGNPTEEAAAREVGAALGIPANPRTPELGPVPADGVVVVLTGDITL